MPKRMSLMTLRRDLTTTLLVTLFSGTALAQESRDPSDAEEPKHALNAPSKFSDRPLMIQLRGGIDTLVGLFGLTASYDVHNRLALGAGLGTNAAGLQLAVFARVRPLMALRRVMPEIHLRKALFRTSHCLRSVPSAKSLPVCC